MLNIRGMRDYNKRRQFFHKFHLSKTDVIFLQETHCTKEVAKAWNSQWGSKIWNSFGSNDARGVSILFRKQLDIEVHNYLSDDDGRYLMLYCTLAGHKFLIANVYVPNSDDVEFARKLVKDLQRFTPEYYIIGGDFNFVMNTQVDKIGSAKNTHIKIAECIKSFMASEELNDIWRTCNQDKIEFTWHRTRPKAFSRLDFFLTSDSLNQFVNNCDIKLGFKMDHAIVELGRDFTTSARGPGYWKLNTALLHDQEYVKKMNSLLDIQLEQQYSSHKKLWELVKLAVKGSTLQYSSRKKKSNDKKLQVLEKKALQIRNKLHNQPTILLESEDVHLGRVSKEIENIMMEKTKGAILRSRATWELHAGKPSKYFMQLEKKNFSKKTIHRLKRQGGTITSDPKEIQSMLTEYYRQLYHTVGPINEKYLDGMETPTISKEMREELDKPISMAELSQAVRQLQNNKVGGTDGIPIDWYKMFWPKIKTVICLSYFKKFCKKRKCTCQLGGHFR